MKNHLHCTVSACVLLLTAAYIQMRQGFPDPFTVSFLLMTMTTIIHHSRQEKWWYHDIWRWLDYAAIVLFSGFAMKKCIEQSQIIHWLCTSMTCFVLYSIIWNEKIPEKDYSFYHSLIHYAVGMTVLMISCDC